MGEVNMRLTVKDELNQAKVTFKENETKAEPEAEAEQEAEAETQKDQVESNHVVNPCTQQGQNPMQQPQRDMLEQKLTNKNPYKYPELLENYETLYMEFGYIGTAKFKDFGDLLPTIFNVYARDDLNAIIYNGHAGDYDFYDLEFFSQELKTDENDCKDEWKLYSNGDIYLGNDLVLQYI